MTMAVSSVPDVLTKQQVCDWLAALGINPNDVPLGAVLTLGPTAVSIEIYARNEQGQRFIGPDRKHAAMHMVTIPIVDMDAEELAQARYTVAAGGCATS